MYSPGTIQALNRDAATKARIARKEPVVLDAYETPGTIGAKGGIPHLGDHVPAGWRRTEREEFFVDTSGLGREYEPALTIEQFIREITPGKGYAVVSAGQFQAYIAEFEQV